MFCCTNPRRNCCCNFRGSNCCNSNNCCNSCGSNCCNTNSSTTCRCRCCCVPNQRPFNASGEGFTLDVHTFDGIELADVRFDGFKLENMLSGDGNTALVVQRSGCYELEYLVTVSDFVTSDFGYEGIDVFMSVNGDPLLPPVRVDPAGAFDFPAVARDTRPAVQLRRGDKITLVLHPTAEGDLTITPSAWLEARRTGDVC